MLGQKGRGRGTAAERWLPLAYFAAAVILVLTLLPTVLRPPQQPPTQSAELSPDAPPDDEQQSIISALNRAQSATAGNDGSDDLGEGTSTAPAPPPVTLRPGRGRCFGNPPRQFESVYAPPCAAAFTGDNGGNTHQGVTATEIKVGLMMELTGTATDGPIPVEATPEESENQRTYRVLQQYFNQRLELYGRQIRLHYVGTPEGRVREQGDRARAQKADEEIGAFAVMQETKPAEIDELTRRGIVTYTQAQLPHSFFEEPGRRPYLWSFTPDATTLIRMGADYYCKKLHGKNARFAGDPLYQGQPRKLGLIVYNSLSAYSDNAANTRRYLQEGCGAEAPTAVTYTLDESGTADLATAVSRLKIDGITTVMYLGDLISAVPFTAAAQSNAYFPEWFIPGFGGVDTDAAVARAYDQNQWSRAFGFSVYELPFADPQTECWVAYKSIDPGNNPNRGICRYLWGQMVELFGGFQQAGPNLTPATFEAGQLAQRREPPTPFWRMAGGYGRGDYTYPDYAAELWWDRDAIHPDGQLGAYRYPRGGRRYAIGEFPAEDPVVFQEGVVSGNPP